MGLFSVEPSKPWYSTINLLGVPPPGPARHSFMYVFPGYRFTLSPESFRSAATAAYHCVDVSDALEGVVEAAVRHLDQHLLDRTIVVLRVHKLRDAERLTWNRQWSTES